jgi:hypothetical protein
MRINRMARVSWKVLQFLSGRWLFERRRWANGEDMIGMCIALGFFWGATCGAVRMAVTPGEERPMVSALAAADLPLAATDETADDLSTRRPAAAVIASTR